MAKLRPVLIPIGPSIAYVRLTRGQFALIDRGAAALVGAFNWYAQWSPNTQSFYAAKRLHGQTKGMALHSFLTGTSPTDHRNHVTLNNLPHNLRPCTRLENASNRRKQTNKSGFKGVSVENGKYRALIRKDSRLISLGTFVLACEAAKAYDDAARRCFGEFATTNFSPTRTSSDLQESANV